MIWWCASCAESSRRVRAVAASRMPGGWSIDEQISIDQPPGIRDAATALTLRLDSAHEAHHQIMECLGEMIWTAQRSGLPLDGDAYVESVRRRLK